MLRQIAKWSLILSISYLTSAALFALLLLLDFALSKATYVFPGDLMPVCFVIMLYSIPATLLLLSARAIQKWLIDDDKAELQKGLKLLKSSLQTTTIFSILLMALFLTISWGFAIINWNSPF